MLFQGRIESDGKEIGQNFFADAFGEGLAFGFVLLPMAFDAMAEDLVEEDAGRAAGKDRGSDKWLGSGAVGERFHVVRRPSLLRRE